MAQSFGDGGMPASSLWQPEQALWLTGFVLKAPFFNQNASSARFFGGGVTNSSFDFPCGWCVS